MCCWVALLESPDVGALRRRGRRRCWFELVDGVDVIALVVRLLRNVDLLCNKSRVAIYGSQHSYTQFGGFPRGKGRHESKATKDRRA